MTAPDFALGLAGFIGSAVALIHGWLIQRLMVVPIRRQVAAAPAGLRAMTRLVAPLLQFSTFAWFTEGIALMVAAYGLAPNAQSVIGMLVGSHYLFGAVGNLNATRRAHPGWVLMAIAVALILYSLSSHR